LGECRGPLYPLHRGGILKGKGKIQREKSLSGNQVNRKWISGEKGIRKGIKD
jgi:hypothetical protein